jgi:hypothetical protein
MRFNPVWMNARGSDDPGLVSGNINTFAGPKFLCP